MKTYSELEEEIFSINEELEELVYFYKHPISKDIPLDELIACRNSIKKLEDRKKTLRWVLDVD